MKKVKKEKEHIVFPETHGCSGCKHLDKKLTESPCDMCDPWGNMWEAGDGDE